ncbi:MAG: regulatory protein RecX [Fimbriimonadaceae bacterium]
MEPRSALSTALKWLERADRSQSELETYLTKKQFAPEEIAETINKLSDYGYLNDHSLSNRVTKSLRNNLAGELKINQKLEQRGLEPIDLTGDATERAIALLTKKFLLNQSTNEPKMLAKAARYLASQGYTEEEIENAITQFFPNCEI